jgi:hypothetical protein
VGWKWPVFITVTILGLLGLAAVGVHFRLDGLLEDHRRECALILGEFPVDLTPRPAILGPAEPGNVWDCYRPAFAALKAQDPDAHWELSAEMATLFQIWEVPATPPPWLQAAEPSLDLCRSGARRRDLAWQGPKDPGLEAAAFRAVKALCSRSFLAWRAGRDADAAEDLVAALTLTGDVGRLGGSGEFLRLAEPHILDHFSKLLSLQGLSASQLEALEHQVDLVRAARLGFRHRLREAGARGRLEVLDHDPEVQDEISGFRFPLSQKIDGRDLYSLRLAKVRILRAIRSCGRDLESVAWTPGAAPSAEMQRILSGYEGRHVTDLMPYYWVAAKQEENVLNLEILSLALRCARYQAVHGRLPASGTESESTLPFASQVKFFGERIFLDTSTLGLMVFDSEVRQAWTIRRRE